MEYNRLTNEQVERTLNNLFMIRHYDKTSIVYNDKPNKKKNIDNKSKITSIASNYKIYSCEVHEHKSLDDIKYNQNIKHLLKYNDTLEFANTKPRTDIIILIDDEKFDRSHLTAILLLLDDIEEYKVDEIEVIFTTRIQKLIIPDVLIEELENRNMKCNVYSLFEIYPLIGSPTALYGMAYGFELVEYQKLFNKCEYKLIHVSDPLVKILNGKCDQLVVGERVCFETSAYSEITIRKIVSVV